MPALTSAAGLVGFLSEPDPTLQAFALERLNDEIDSVWTEVSASIGQMYVFWFLSMRSSFASSGDVGSYALSMCMKHPRALSSHA